jgi:homoserine dehydrogenase
MLTSDFLGDSLHVGKGAGSHPTASAVVSDVNDLALYILNKEEFNNNRYKPFNTYRTVRHTETSSRFYLRLSTVDKVGILAIITKILGEHNISISSIIQEELDVDRPIPIVILTHMANEENLRNAVEKINALDITKEKTIVMHIEDIEL